MTGVGARWLRIAALMAAGALVAAACGSGGAPAGRGPSPSAGPGGDGVPSAPPSSLALGPTTTSPPTVLPRATAPGCPAIPTRRSPDPGRPRYELDVAVSPADALAEGTQSVTFTPDLATDRLELRLWPNGPRQRAAGAGITVGPVTVDGVEVPTALEEPTRLVVRPPGGLARGRAVTARFAWRLVLPRGVRDRIGATAESAWLGSFLPLLEWVPGRGWLDDPPTTQFSEASTAPVADFDLRVSGPPGTTVLASGSPAGPGRWQATAMRDVAVAVGRFRLATGTARAPGPVAVTVGVQAGLAEAPETYRDRAIATLEDLARRYGPYPWDTFVVSVTPVLRSGVEYPGHVLHGPGTSGRQLTHEVGHQWFYALVGNDQAREPWLDEGLATWAEARADGTLAAYLARAVPAAVRGRTAEPMTFWDQRSSQFYVGAYVQGAQALGSLGDPALVDCALAVYVAQNAHRVATAEDLLVAAEAVVPDARARLAAWGVTG